MPEVKLCKDCRFLGIEPEEYPSGLELPPIDICMNPKAATVRMDMVTGQVVTHHPCPRNQRELGWLESRVFGYCGRSGRWWRSKDV